MTVDIDGIMSGNTAATSADSAGTEQTSAYRSVTNENPYEFVTHAHEGTGGFRDGTYLIPHEREMFYNKRRENAFYKNWLKPIVRAMIEPVFDERVPHNVVSSTDETVEVSNAMADSFVEDCDGGGNSLQSFMQTTMRYARMHGTCFVVMDNATSEFIPVRQIDAVESRSFPYVYRKLANELYKGEAGSDRDIYRKGYHVNERGQLEWIIFRTDDDYTDKSNRARWLMWTTTSVVRVKVVGGVLKPVAGTERVHDLGVVPVVVVRSAEPEDVRVLLVNPPVYDLARACHSLFNRESEIRFQERAQGFSIFYMQTDTPSSAFTVGNKTILFVPMDASIAPGFASPDPSILTGLVSNAVGLREDIFRLAEQNGVTGVQDSASGIAKQWDFFAHESVLQKTSEIVREATLRIGKLFGFYVNADISISAEYPTDFQPNEAEKELKLYDTYMMMTGVPPSGNALALEKSTRLVFSDESPERVDVVIKDIQAAQKDAENARKEAKMAADATAAAAAEGDDEDLNDPDKGGTDDGAAAGKGDAGAGAGGDGA